MGVPIRRRSKFLWPLFWLMPWLFLFAVTGSLIDLFRGESISGAVWSSRFERGPDGVLADSFGGGGGRGIFGAESRPPIIDVSLSTSHSYARRQVWFQFGEGCWARMEWTLSVQPETGFAALTAAEHTGIVKDLFDHCQEPMPAEAAAALSPGETQRVGHVTDVHYGLMAVWLLTGAPGVVVLAWFLTGVALWVTRDFGRKWMLCGNCGYDRTGVAKDALCPECGTSGAQTVCPECGKPP